MTDHDRAHRLIVAGSALAAAKQAATDRLPRETGGILIGFRSGDDVYIVDAIEIGDDRSTGSSFVLREDPREQALADYRRDAPDSPFGYVGSWHSHPAPAEVSRRDLRTLRQEAKAARDLVAMMVLMRASDDGWMTQAAVGYRQHGCARAAGRPPTFRPAVMTADVIERPADQPTPPGYGQPDGAGSEPST